MGGGLCNLHGRDRLCRALIGKSGNQWCGWSASQRRPILDDVVRRSEGRGCAGQMVFSGTHQRWPIATETPRDRSAPTSEPPAAGPCRTARAGGRCRTPVLDWRDAHRPARRGGLALRRRRRRLRGRPPAPRRAARPHLGRRGRRGVRRPLPDRARRPVAHPPRAGRLGHRARHARDRAGLRRRGHLDPRRRARPAPRRPRRRRPRGVGLHQHAPGAPPRPRTGADSGGAGV